jgi:hypothetical protein
MTLLSELSAKLPPGTSIELTDTATGKALGIFEVADVNCARGQEDSVVFVAYRPIGSKHPGELLIFHPGTFPNSMNKPQITLRSIHPVPSGRAGHP